MKFRQIPLAQVSGSAEVAYEVLDDDTRIGVVSRRGKQWVAWNTRAGTWAKAPTRREAAESLGDV